MATSFSNETTSKTETPKKPLSFSDLKAGSSSNSSGGSSVRRAPPDNVAYGGGAHDV
jgi:hypothetical protein